MKKWVLAAGLMFCLAAAPVRAQSVQDMLDARDVSGAIDRLAKDITSEDAEAVAFALSALAQISLERDDLEKARLFADTLEGKLQDRGFVAGLKHSRKSGWPAVSAWISASVHEAAGEAEEARSDLRRALSASEGAHLEDGWRGVMHYGLARMLAADDQRHARDAAEKAIEAYRGAGDRAGQAYAAVLLGDLELARDKVKRAAGHYADALRLIRETGRKYDIAYIHVSVAEKLAQAGESRFMPSVDAVAADVAAAGNPEELVERLRKIQPAS